jgi:Ca2+-binding RTX toxin-like protein
VSTRRLGLLAAGAVILLASADVWAQTAPTCSFTADTATLTVTLNGVAGSLTRTGPGQIKLGTTTCTGATVATTDTIVVNGGDLNDQLTVTGSFAPGLTAEGDGNSEIEFVFQLGVGNDTARVNYTDNAENITFTAGGIDFGNDLDEDFTTSGTDIVKVYAFGGNDVVDLANYIGGGKVYVYGGDGDDTLYGSNQADWMYGNNGNDIMSGNAGADRLYGGPDNDDYYGDAGNDIFYQDAVVDGNDNFYGGADTDTVNYSKRLVGVNVSLGNGLIDDGEPGTELDFVDIDVENATGGAGDDVLVGNDLANTLTGGVGADELYGGESNDDLLGGDGDDILVGDAGGDTMHGDKGNDSLDGGIGPDKMFGGAGIDTLTGGPGMDSFFGEAGNDKFFNNDGAADTVDCGTGAGDDPEPDAFDTFVACELI